VDAAGQTVDFFLSRNRDGNPADTFLHSLRKNWRTPTKSRSKLKQQGDARYGKGSKPANFRPE
jgi:transposase-like protein